MYNINPTSYSGLTVIVSTSSGCSAVMASNSTVDVSVTMTSGTTACVLAASQGGDNNYNAASDVARTVKVGRAKWRVRLVQPASAATYGTMLVVKTTSDSGLTEGVGASSGCCVVCGTVHVTS